MMQKALQQLAPTAFTTPFLTMLPLIHCLLPSCPSSYPIHVPAFAYLRTFARMLHPLPTMFFLSPFPWLAPHPPNHLIILISFNKSA